jgi:ABC-type branched-subunit amino acid transport system substrate-binding protein
MNPMTSRLSNRLAYAGIGTIFVLTACATDSVQQRPGQPAEKPAPSIVSKRTLISAAANPESAPLNANSAETTPDLREYNEVHKLYSNQAFNAAFTRLEGFESRFPKSYLLSQVANMRGLCLLLTHRPDQAIEQFQKAIRLNTTNPGFTPYLTYNLAKAQFDAGQIDASEQSANQVDFAKLDNDNKLKFRFLKAGIYSKRKFDYEAAREILSISREVNPLTPELKKVIETSLDYSLKEIVGTQQLSDLYRENEASPLADGLLFRLGSKEKHLGLDGKAESHLRLLVARFPNSPYANEARELLKSSVDTTVDRKTIGVLLPLKGKFARFGQRNLQAIEQAFGIFDLESPDTGIQLAVEDSGDEPAQAIKALNRLVSKHHVAAVIGPLLSKGIDQVTRRAAELGVPLVSLSRHEGVADNYVVQAGMTLQMQTYEIARYAIQNRGLRRFAILSPKGQVGDESAQYFWDAVESMGGQVVGIESYSPTETDFREVVDKLSGLYYTEARQNELDELARQRQVNQIKKRNRKTEQYFSLPPIVDYDAVFIADDAKISGQILPTFAYRDVEHVQFLGTSTWNSPELASRAEKNAEGALFVDAFFPGSQSERVRNFIDQFKTQFGSDPNGMDAMAYDAALVVLKAMESAGSNYSRADLLDKIRDTKGLRGVTGNISFKDGALVRNLRVLSVQGGQIIEETK